MKLLNSANWFTVFILAAAWTLIAPDFASAQTNQGGFVIRDPVTNGYQNQQRPKSKNWGIQSERPPATRKFLPARWTQDQEQDESPQKKLDRDVDSVDLQDKFQDQLQGEIQEGAELDLENLAQGRRTQFDFGEWPRKTIYEIRPSVKDDNDVVPDDYSYLLTDKPGPDWFSAPSGSKVFAWVAPNIRYQPLYFQNVALERYGQNYGGLKQIGASGVHFFTSFCRLPYAVIADHPRSCEYPLGYCRPGNPTSLTFQKLLYPCRD